MFTTLIVVVHIIVSIMLILIILLQTGKGADIGAVFGGGSSQTVFGSTGASTFLSKITIVAAVTFMVTSILLTYYAGRSVSIERSIMGVQSGPAVPGEPGQGPVPGEGGAVPAPASTPSVPAEKPAGESMPEKR